jgi:phosphotransferase system enzyme I (PtsI)
MKAIAAAGGIAVGRAVCVIDEVPVIDKQVVADPSLELKKLEEALALTTSELEVIRDRTKERVGEEEAAVFEAHLMMVHDPEWTGKAKNVIETESVNATYALKSATDTLVAMFEAIDDEYLKARAADLVDVSDRVIGHLTGVKKQDLSHFDEPTVLIAEDLSPSQTAAMDAEQVVAIVTEKGNRTSHSVIIAKSLGIPALVGLSADHGITDGAMVIVDGSTGEILVDPEEAVLDRYLALQQKEREEKALLDALIGQESITKDGRRVELAGNIARPADVEPVLANDGEGVGLFRSEFLFMDRKTPPSEDEQAVVYGEVAEKMGGRPVIIRTLDAGGDKNVPYLNVASELNPFLGYRALRICLDDTALFKTQLRALLRASTRGKIKIMFPMVTTLSEFREAKALLEEAKAELTEAGTAFDAAIQCGIMVEIPSTAVMARAFAKEVDFFSIGTNDLTQYTLACDRMNERLTDLYSPFDPAVLHLIKMTIDAGREAGIMVGMCGEAAGDERLIPLLLGMGLDEFSMSAGSILRARQLVRSHDTKALQSLVEKVMGLSTETEVRATLEEFMKEND